MKDQEASFSKAIEEGINAYKTEKESVFQSLLGKYEKHPQSMWMMMKMTSYLLRVDEANRICVQERTEKERLLAEKSSSFENEIRKVNEISRREKAILEGTVREESTIIEELRHQVGEVTSKSLCHAFLVQVLGTSSTELLFSLFSLQSARIEVGSLRISNGIETQLI